MKKLFLILPFVISCGGNGNQANGLAFNFIPNTPFINSAANSTCMASGISYPAPCFTAQKMHIVWSPDPGGSFSANNVLIVSVTIKTTAGTGQLAAPLNCTFGGDQLNSILGGTYNPAVGLAPPTTPLDTGPLGCSLTLVSGATPPFNILATVTLYGLIIDGSENTIGRATATQSITLN